MIHRDHKLKWQYMGHTELREILFKINFTHLFCFKCGCENILKYNMWFAFKFCYMVHQSDLHLTLCVAAVLVYRVVSNSFGTPWTVTCQVLLTEFPGKNIRVGCHFLRQWIFLIQG